MSNHYTAKIYCGTTNIAHQSGDDLEKLYLWMITYAANNSGDLHGEILDNLSQEVVRHFKKRSEE